MVANSPGAVENTEKSHQYFIVNSWYFMYGILQRKGKHLFGFLLMPGTGVLMIFTSINQSFSILRYQINIWNADAKHTRNTKLKFSLYLQMSWHHMVPGHQQTQTWLSSHVHFLHSFRIVINEFCLNFMDQMTYKMVDLKTLIIFLVDPKEYIFKWIINKVNHE